MTVKKARIEPLEDLQQAENGSYYTIRGTGGDLMEWVEGYEGLMVEEGIGKPVQWYSTTGVAVNRYANPGRWEDAFPYDTTFLLFPLDGLDIGKLALFKLRMQDVWFDDMVTNMKGAF